MEPQYYGGQITGAIPPKKSFWTKGKITAIAIVALILVVAIAAMSAGGGTPKKGSSISESFMQSVVDGKSSSALDLMSKDLRDRRGDEEWQSIIKSVSSNYTSYTLKSDEKTVSADKKTTYTRYRYTLAAKSSKTKGLEAEVRINETEGQKPALDGFKLTQVE